MKKIVLALSLCLSTVFLFSFRSANTANQEMGNIDNYTVNQQNLNEFLGLYQDWQSNGGPEAIPTRVLLQAGVRYARAVWNATGRQAFWEAMDYLLGPSSAQIPQEDLDVAEQIGIIQRL